MSDTLLEVQNLKKYFPTPGGMLHAVDGVNFTIANGSTIGVVGESGCGKTTLGRLVIRLLEPTDGEVIFCGKNVFSMNTKEMLEIRKVMQIIFQDPFSSLNPRMTVGEIIAEPMKVCKTVRSGNEMNKRIFELMGTVGLAKRYINTYPHELDGGRRQRIGIARALSVNPKFIVCDEPVSALDVSIQAQILNLMMDLQDEFGLAYMFITHDLSVVRHISDEIMVMYLGQCVEKCSALELFEKPLHPYTRALLDAIPEPNFSKRNVQRKIIKGEVTSPINPKPGCRFAARCNFVRERCNDEVPLTEVEPGHLVACPFCDEKYP